MAFVIGNANKMLLLFDRIVGAWKLKLGKNITRHYLPKGLTMLFLLPVIAILVNELLRKMIKYQVIIFTHLHTVKFELTNQHSVGGKNCGVLTSCRFCALRFDFCVISEVYTVEIRFYFSVFFKLTACLTSIY